MILVVIIRRWLMNLSRLGLVVAIAHRRDGSRVRFSVCFINDSGLMISSRGVCNVRGTSSYRRNGTTFDPTYINVNILGYLLGVYFAGGVVVQKPVSGSRESFDDVVLISLSPIEHVCVQ